MEPNTFLYGFQWSGAVRLWRGAEGDLWSVLTAVL
jgi:hypothetical protein